MTKVYIIAEAGVNHNGNPDLAFNLIDIACEAGADAIKFQTFKASKLVTQHASKALYQTKTTNANETQYEMLKQLELDHETFKHLSEYSESKGIDFLSTAFDEDSLYFLHNELSLNTLKIPSGEITNAPLLLAHSRTGSDLIVSTGMATLQEIQRALEIISFGYLNSFGVEPKSKKCFRNAFLTKEGQEMLNNKVSLLHCTTEYPAPFSEINLNAILTMKKKFQLPVGYSDHSAGITVSIAAAAIGANIIEKHFTINRDMVGPDHKASIEPDELKSLVEGIRTVEVCMGNGKKLPMQSEIKNINIARKSIVANKEIKRGEKFTTKNLAIKRPGNGMSPYEYWNILGKISAQDFDKDDFIK